MISHFQCRMARAALGIQVRELAALADVSPSTIARFEKGDELKSRTVSAIESALCDQGIEFMYGSGVVGDGAALTYKPHFIKKLTDAVTKHGLLVTKLSDGFDLDLSRDPIEPAAITNLARRLSGYDGGPIRAVEVFLESAAFYSAVAFYDSAKMTRKQAAESAGSIVEEDDDDTPPSDT